MIKENNQIDMFEIAESLVNQLKNEALERVKHRILRDGDVISVKAKFDGFGEKFSTDQIDELQKMVSNRLTKILNETCKKN